MNTLITAATSSQAYQLKGKLNAQRIMLGDYLELPAFMLKANEMIQLPNPKSTSYAHEMLTLCLDKEVDTIYVLRDEEYALLNEAVQLFNEYGIRIVNNF